MRGLTIESVAAASGASKMTIHRMWPSRGALALEGHVATVESTLTFPDTGDVEADIRTQIQSFVHLLTTTTAGRVIAELIGRAQTDPDLMAAYLATYSGPRRDLAEQHLDKARTEGQLRQNLDGESIVDQLWGACYHRLLLPNNPSTQPSRTHWSTTSFTASALDRRPCPACPAAARRGSVPPQEPRRASTQGFRDLLKRPDPRTRQRPEPAS